MPKQIKLPNGDAQAKSAKVLAKQNSANYRTKLKAYKEYRKGLEASKRAAVKARNKEYGALLVKARDTGLYAPKSTELTTYRKRRLRELKQSHGEYLSGEYFFLPANADKRKQILERADNLKITTSRTGIFYPRDKFKKATLKYDKKYDEYYIERRGKTKRGINTGRTYRDHSPLTTIDALTKEEGRLARMVKRLGKINIEAGERYAFVVREDGVEGFSDGTFDSIETILRYLNKYPKNVAARVNFYRHIRIVKTSVMEWKELHPGRSPGPKGRPRIVKGQKNTRSSK